MDQLVRKYCIITAHSSYRLGDSTQKGEKERKRERGDPRWAREATHASLSSIRLIPRGFRAKTWPTFPPVRSCVCGHQILQTMESWWGGRTTNQPTNQRTNMIFPAKNSPRFFTNDSKGGRMPFFTNTVGFIYLFAISSHSCWTTGIGSKKRGYDMEKSE